ncbi:MAG: glycosyltransferase family 4 protein [Bacteroidales bacterium]|nr:glycosyltransferase family 4 protein [Bacteroidales bacterium]
MKICFWGKIANALTGKTGGGGELQIALMARTLAGLGHEVVVVDLDNDHEFTTSEGIRVCPVNGYNKGLKGLRTFTHRLPGLYSTFVNIKADVYYCRIREYRHLIVYMAARKVKAKFILGLASDLDILSLPKRWRHFYSSNVRDLWGVFNGLAGELAYPYLLRNADRVIVQHKGQKDLLGKKNIDSSVFPNIIDTSSIKTFLDPERKEFVYVGSLDKRKGFAFFFKIVQLSPSHTFKVIGSPRDKTGNYFYQRLKSFNNVTLTGRLSHEETIRQISGSKALISTSPMEGFPNIFIEAWACGVPVLSLFVDPGGVIKKAGLGEIAGGNIKSLLAALDNFKFANGFAEKAKGYIKENHELNSERISEMERLFNDVYAGRVMQTNTTSGQGLAL